MYTQISAEAVSIIVFKRKVMEGKCKIHLQHLQKTPTYYKHKIQIDTMWPLARAISPLLAHQARVATWCPVSIAWAWWQTPLPWPSGSDSSCTLAQPLLWKIDDDLAPELCKSKHLSNPVLGPIPATLFHTCGNWQAKLAWHLSSHYFLQIKTRQAPEHNHWVAGQ